MVFRLLEVMDGQSLWWMESIDRYEITRRRDRVKFYVQGRLLWT